MLPLPVTEIPLAECNGSSFCHAGRGGACYFKMREEPWELGYSVIFGCLRYQRSQELCPWGRMKEHDCCLSNGCNGRIGKSVNIMQLGLQCMWYGISEHIIAKTMEFIPCIISAAGKGVHVTQRPMSLLAPDSVCTCVQCRVLHVVNCICTS